jgi:hypothetical protein
MTPSEAEIAQALLRLARARGHGRSFCPSEAARALATEWRAILPHVRHEAARLQARGMLAASQRGVPVDVAQARGPIRLHLPRAPENAP